ncbi:GNAT family N-acetyltransferase [Azospirillum sp. ST 5-10]|uniref:GNAT family N-acetyltransferase n=1 Tax=unclassified Azospirillum TaxID=2630922 RepID=UPI003F4A051F
MLPDLATGRLRLRPRAPADLEACLDMDADPEVMRHAGGAWTDAAAYRDHLRQRLALAWPAGLGYWSAFTKTDGRFVGWIALIPLEEEEGAVEIGWRLRRDAWGNGFATEAAAAVIGHAFATLGLHRLVATTHPENAASVRVAERLGFRFVGHGRYGDEPCLRFERTAGLAP